MNYEVLDFTINAGGHDLKVFFESVSEQKNLLLSISLDGFPLDIDILRETDKDLCGRIHEQMKKESKFFWNRGQRQTFDKMPDLVMLSNNFFNQFKN